MRKGRLVISPLLATLALAGTSCARTPGVPPPDMAVRELATIDVRVRGTWRLVRFTPEVSLEPMLKALVESQYNVLVVRFDGRRFVAESPGIHVDRAYRIEQASGDRFHLVSFDENGVPYDTACTFLPNDMLEINSWTPPWRGVGQLVKIGGPETAVPQPQLPQRPYR